MKYIPTYNTFLNEMAFVKRSSDEIAKSKEDILKQSTLLKNKSKIESLETKNDYFSKLFDMLEASTQGGDKSEIESFVGSIKNFNLKSFAAYYALKLGSVADVEGLLKNFLVDGKAEAMLSDNPILNDYLEAINNNSYLKYVDISINDDNHNSNIAKSLAYLKLKKANPSKLALFQSEYKTSFTIWEKALKNSKTVKEAYLLNVKENEIKTWFDGLEQSYLDNGQLDSDEVFDLMYYVGGLGESVTDLIVDYKMLEEYANVNAKSNLLQSIVKSISDQEAIWSIIDDAALLARFKRIFGLSQSNTTSMAGAYAFKGVLTFEFENTPYSIPYDSKKISELVAKVGDIVGIDYFANNSKTQADKPDKKYNLKFKVDEDPTTGFKKLKTIKTSGEDGGTQRKVVAYVLNSLALEFNFDDN